MYEWRNAKVTANVRKAFELATDIAWTFDDEKIRSAYMLFAAMNIPDSAISKVISDMYAYMLPDLGTILRNKEVFADIFGKEAADKNFTDQSEEEDVSEEQIEEEHDEIKDITK